MTNLAQDQAENLIHDLREELGPQVFNEVMDAARAEMSKPDFDPKTSPLLQRYGEGDTVGGGSLQILFNELLGFTNEAGRHVISE